MILVLSKSAVGLGKDMIGEHLAGTGGVREHAIEDPPPALVLVHAELDEVAQIAPALRAAERHGVTDAVAKRIGRALIISALIAQERDHITRRRKTDADHLRVARLIEQFVD